MSYTRLFPKGYFKKDSKTLNKTDISEMLGVIEAMKSDKDQLDLALLEAVAYPDSNQILKRLLELKADLPSALQLAVDAPEEKEAAINFEAIKNDEDQLNLTLFKAAESADSSNEVISQLLMLKATPNLALAFAKPNTPSNVIQRLIALNLDTYDKSGHTAVTTAASHANVPVLQALLDAKANPNASGSRDKFRAIHRAAFSNNSAIVKPLVDAKADLGAVTTYAGDPGIGVTPLTWAVSRKSHQTVAALTAVIEAASAEKSRKRKAPAEESAVGPGAGAAQTEDDHAAKRIKMQPNNATDQNLEELELRKAYSALAF